MDTPMDVEEPAALPMDVEEPTDSTDSDGFDYVREKSVFERCGEIVRRRTSINRKKPRLWKHQLDALSGLEDWFRNPDTTRKVGLVVMPTGTGKTGVICCLPYYLATADLDINFSRKPILVIVPSLAIYGQSMKELSPGDGGAESFLMKRGILTQDAAGRDAAPSVRGVESAKDLDKFKLGTGVDIVVTNPHKWHSGKDAIWRELPDDHFSMVIVDEAHHLPASQWKIVVDKFDTHAKVVFFTATPFRADKQPITDSITGAGYAYRLTLDQAVKERVIRKTCFEQSIPNGKCDGSCKLESWKQRFNPYSHETVDVVRAVIGKLDEKDRSQDLRLPGGTKHAAIITVQDIATTKQVASIIDPKYPAAAVHSGLRSHEVEAILRELGKGRIRILIVVSKLLEGFDHPPISIAAICSNVVSPVKFIQFVGRAQRILRIKDISEEESPLVEADIITHPRFNQRENYDKFINETLIVIPEKYETDHS